MSTPSEAYRLTDHLFETFLGRNTALRPDELTNAGVGKTEEIDQEEPSRIEVQGQIDGRRVVQMISKDQDGNFHFSTSFIGTKEGHIEYDIQPEIEKELLDLEPTKAVRQSLFMAKLVHIALTR
jgi:pyocin large subunit-like protein